LTTRSAGLVNEVRKSAAVARSAHTKPRSVK